jgi:hypothetical protein
MSKFADASLLDGKEFTFSLYAIEEDVLKGNVFTASYFTAQVNLDLNPRGGFAIYQHSFRLDLASLKIELEKIDLIKAASLLHPHRIADALIYCYHEAADFLVDYNGIKDDYEGLATLLYKYNGSSAARDFNI